jgi:hypothetical protein
MIALPLSTAETITWREFVTTLWQPLQDELVARGAHRPQAHSGVGLGA